MTFDTNFILSFGAAHTHSGNRNRNHIFALIFLHHCQLAARVPAGRPGQMGQVGQMGAPIESREQGEASREQLRALSAAANKLHCSLVHESGQDLAPG